MITPESVERAKDLLAEIAHLGGNLADLFSAECRAGNITDELVQHSIGQSMIAFTVGVIQLSDAAERGFARPETVGLIPTTSLPDFNLSMPAGTPNN